MLVHPNTSSWTDQIQAARELPSRWDLNLIADVMEEISEQWEGVIEAYIGVAGGYFWRNEDQDKPRHEVRILLAPAGRPHEDDPVFEVLYFGDTGLNRLTAADRCKRETAPEVLTAFLYNLATPHSDQSHSHR